MKGWACIQNRYLKVVRERYFKAKAGQKRTEFRMNVAVTLDGANNLA